MDASWSNKIEELMSHDGEGPPGSLPRPFLGCLLLSPGRPSPGRPSPARHSVLSSSLCQGPLSPYDSAQPLPPKDVLLGPSSPPKHTCTDAPDTTPLPDPCHHHPKALTGPWARRGRVDFFFIFRAVSEQAYSGQSQIHCPLSLQAAWDPGSVFPSLCFHLLPFILTPRNEVDPPHIRRVNTLRSPGWGRKNLHEKC